MTTVYMDGFEQYGGSNATMLYGPWTSIQSNGALNVLQTPTWGARTGSVAMTCINASGSNTLPLPVPLGNMFMSLGFSVGAIPTANFQSMICSFQTGLGTDFARLWCQANGSIVLTDGSNNPLASSASGLISTPSVWYALEFNFNQAGGTFTLRVNDVTGTSTPAISATGLSLGSSAVAMLTFVNCGRTQLDWVDDLFIRNILGTLNNSWLGERYIGTISMTGNSPFIESPPPTSALISAIQVSYLSATGLMTPSDQLIETPSTVTINPDITSTINSVLVGPLGGQTVGTIHTVNAALKWFNDVYETNPDTGKFLTPAIVANSSIDLGGLYVSQVPYLLVAYSIAVSPGALSTQSLPAWTFVMDGHRFYVLSLGPEGDWAYDFTTREWCQLQSQGFPGMNFTRGVMWGLYVVGGDVLYPYLYELDPTEPLDEGWRPVQHMVTGGVPTRTRSVIGVANFTVTASVGLDSSESQPISLAFSDDNGFTWSPEFDEPLTDTSTQMLIWNSLGSFAAPGRIFRITDYSGPIRLDGADVVLTIGSGADSGQQTDGQPAH